jgi:hypothetical protein
MKNSPTTRSTAHKGASRSGNHGSGLAVVPRPIVPTLSPDSARGTPGGANENGITVSEQELGSVKAQRLYKMRCDCGRSWFELELPRLVECPACRKLCLVSA